MLSPEWAATAEYDLFHVHFGFDACTPDHLEQLTAVLRERGKPLVVTVHDLRNPHHHERDLHDQQLEVLVRNADRLVTLTQGAAAEIARRWGRDCIVVPHPHVADFATMATLQANRSARPTAEFRVGLHLKSLRANMAPMQVLPTLVETVQTLAGAELQVNAHRDVFEPNGPRYNPEVAQWLRAHACAGQLDLRVHDFFTDAELWDYLASLDVSILPYRFGTHSGWLEACRDVGTTVIAPTCGYYTDQGDVLSYTLNESEYDPVSLASAITLAHTERPRLGATVQARRHQRELIAERHHQLYAELS